MRFNSVCHGYTVCCAFVIASTMWRRRTTTIPCNAYIIMLSSERHNYQIWSSTWLYDSFTIKSAVEKKKWDFSLVCHRSRLTLFWLLLRGCDFTLGFSKLMMLTHRTNFLTQVQSSVHNGTLLCSLISLKRT